MKRMPIALILLLIVACACNESRDSAPVAKKVFHFPPQSSAKAPSKGTPFTYLGLGTSRWHWDDPGGTKIDLLRFDFKTNSKLRFFIYDRDEDDEEPFDNRVDYRSESAAHAVERLNKKGKFGKTKLSGKRCEPGTIAVPPESSFTSVSKKKTLIIITESG